MALIEEMFKKIRSQAKENLEEYHNGKLSTEKFQDLINRHIRYANSMDLILQIISAGADAEDGKDFINRRKSSFDIQIIGITQDEMQAMTDAEFKGMLKKRTQWMKQELKVLHQVIQEMRQAIHTTD